MNGTKGYAQSKTVVGTAILGAIALMETWGWLPGGAENALVETCQVLAAFLAAVGVRDALPANSGTKLVGLYKSRD